VPLDAGAPDLDGHDALLDAQETARARRFRFDHHRVHFIRAHAQTRRILASYLSANPAELRFQHNRYGRPFVAWPSGPPPLWFSLSHSSGLAMLAVAAEEHIGVDVEHVREVGNPHDIALRFFSPRERLMLEFAHNGDLAQSFFNCWTRKEAFAKALGLGLSIGLARFDVSLLPSDPPALLGCGWDPHEPSRWSFVHFEPRAGFVGALAARVPALSVHYFDCPAFEPAYA
jgi:4'-phosphopantetheinyl transferase